jgi:hypothetical protein
MSWEANMNKKLQVWDIPADFADRFPDGTYTVGRGADPRGKIEDAPAAATKAGPLPKKPAAKRKLRKRVTRTAAE